MILAVTGHRPEKTGGYSPNPLQAYLRERLHAKLSLHEPEKVYTGMALGWDQWTAEVCIQLGIPFVAVIPFPNQSSKWPTHSHLHYLDLLKAAAESVIVSPKFSTTAFQRRNEYMVDKLGRGDVLLSCHNGSSGGTANCLEYARERQQYEGFEIINIDPSGFRG